MSKSPEIPPTLSQQVEATIARTRRLAGSENLMAAVGPSTVHSEMFQIILRDNALLIEELAKAQQTISDLRVQRRIENVRELELQFPRKGRHRQRAG